MTLYTGRRLYYGTYKYIKTTYMSKSYDKTVIFDYYQCRDSNTIVLFVCKIFSL